MQSVSAGGKENSGAETATAKRKKVEDDAALVSARDEVRREQVLRGCW